MVATTAGRGGNEARMPWLVNAMAGGAGSFSASARARVSADCGSGGVLPQMLSSARYLEHKLRARLVVAIR